MTAPHEGADRDFGGRSRTRRRLSRGGEFDRVFREGRSFANRYLVVHVFSRSEDGEGRLGVSVGRRLGGAVERNRIKRLLRESFWASAGEPVAGRDFVIVARPELAKIAAERGSAGVEAQLRELLADAGLAESERDSA
jgi:ribonuclease P protein component